MNTEKFFNSDQSFVVQTLSDLGWSGWEIVNAFHDINYEHVFPKTRIQKFLRGQFRSMHEHIGVDLDSKYANRSRLDECALRKRFQESLKLYFVCIKNLVGFQQFAKYSWLQGALTQLLRICDLSLFCTGILSNVVSSFDDYSTLSKIIFPEMQMGNLEVRSKQIVCEYMGYLSKKKELPSSWFALLADLSKFIQNLCLEESKMPT